MKNIKKIINMSIALVFVLFSSIQLLGMEPRRQQLEQAWQQAQQDEEQALKELHKATILNDLAACERANKAYIQAYTATREAFERYMRELPY